MYQKIILFIVTIFNLVVTTYSINSNYYEASLVSN